MTYPRTLLETICLVFCTTSILASCSGSESSERELVKKEDVPSTGGTASATGGTGTGDGGTTAPDAEDPTSPAITGCVGAQPPDHTIIDDLESGVGPWWVFSDGSGTIDELAAVPGRADAGGSALRLAGAGITGWGAGTGRWTGCMDVSGYGGIAFYARSDLATKLTVQMAVPATVPQDQPDGECLEGCWGHPRASVQLTSAWMQYFVPWSDFSGQTAFARRVVLWTQVAAYEAATAADGAFSFEIDDIEFSNGISAPDPGTAGAGGGG